MKKYLLVFLAMLCAERAAAQSDTTALEKISLENPHTGGYRLLLSGGLGRFNSFLKGDYDIKDNLGNVKIVEFKDIYSKQSPMWGVSAALGLDDGDGRSKGVYLISKYQWFSATGNSIVVNANTTGTAEFRQWLASVGFRWYPPIMDGLIHVEALWTFSKATEKISTQNGQSNLAGESSRSDNGFTLGTGLHIGITKNFQLSGELELPMNGLVNFKNLGGLYGGLSVDYILPFGETHKEGK
jgi:hypothetical protein